MESEIQYRSENRSTAKEIFKKDWSAIGIVIFTLGFFAGALLHSSAVLWFSTCMLFAAFDALGYKTVVKNIHFGEQTVAYRIIQAQFQWFLFFVSTWIACSFEGDWSGLLVGGLYIFYWWMGALEVKYYVFTRELEWYKTYEGPFFWHWWLLPQLIKTLWCQIASKPVTYITGRQTWMVSVVLDAVLFTFWISYTFFKS
jgi:hypothetical protein